MSILDLNLDTDDCLPSLLEDVDAIVEQLIKTKTTEVRASDLNLDSRCGNVRVTEDLDCIIIEEGCTRTINYYGGFEYVDQDYVTKYGNFTIYYSDSERVAGHLDYYKEYSLNKDQD